jgi:hypothetical protein
MTPSRAQDLLNLLRALSRLSFSLTITFAIFLSHLLTSVNYCDKPQRRNDTTAAPKSQQEKIMRTVKSTGDANTRALRHMMPARSAPALFIVPQYLWIIE